MIKITAYVAGFMFSPDYSQVALIRKLKPQWQAGKLNGIGGKIEKGEEPSTAMVREFLEETGAYTYPANWWRFMEMGDGSSFTVHFFVTTGDLSTLRSTEEEQIEIINVSDLGPTRQDVVENLTWLIPLALDYSTDGRPKFVTATY